MNQGALTFLIDEDIKPNLIKLGENLTQCELVYLLPLSCNYTMQLYLQRTTYEWAEYI